MCNLVGEIIHHHLRDFLKDNIHLMKNAPHTKDIIGRLLFKQCHEATMATNHGVLAISTQRDQFVMLH
jgi:hypothetical protein